jgi:hypothetical protein
LVSNLAANQQIASQIANTAADHEIQTPGHLDNIKAKNMTRLNGFRAIFFARVIQEPYEKFAAL